MIQSAGGQSAVPAPARRGRATLAALAFVTAALSGGAGEPVVRVAVTTTMIEAAVTELTAGLPGTVELVRLLPPGSCPGHFDLSARDLARLTKARLILRHDYQSALDQKLAGLAGGGLRVVALTTPGTLLVPNHFLAFARQVSGHLATALPGHEAEVAAALERLGREAGRIERLSRERAATWHNVTVIASAQQRGFCEWLGLKVTGELPRGEDLSPKDLVALQQSGAQAVVANLQSDARAAKALAARLGLPVAVLSNFPGCPNYGVSYGDLLQHNLEELGRACQTASLN